MNKFVTTVRTSLFVAAAVAVSVPAFAGTVESDPSIAVRYGDLNLSSTAGQHRLHNRLVSAARSVCEGNMEVGTKIQPAFNACVTKAMAKANIEFAALTTSTQPQVAVVERAH